MWRANPRAGPHTPASEATRVAGRSNRCGGGGGIAAQRVVPCSAPRSPQLASRASPRRCVPSMPVPCAQTVTRKVVGMTKTDALLIDVKVTLIALLRAGSGDLGPTSRILPETFA